MSSENESLSQRTAFHTAGSHKPIEVKQQSLARVVQLLGAVGQENEEKKSNEDENDFDGDEVDDDLVFSTVPQRSTIASTAQIHFDEIDDEEMRRFAESFEQEQQDVQMDGDEQLCEEYQKKTQTPTKSQEKKGGIEDLDALLDANKDEDDDGEDEENDEMEQHQMSPVFKKKP